jgi:hypothetical protein
MRTLLGTRGQVHEEDGGQLALTQEARDDRLLGVLCLTARTSLDRLPTKTRSAHAALAQHARQADASSDRLWCWSLRWTHFPRS